MARVCSRNDWRAGGAVASRGKATLANAERFAVVDSLDDRAGEASHGAIVLICGCINGRIFDADLNAGGFMRTTVTIDDELVAKAIELTGRSDTGFLVRSGLEALVARESARRLAALGGGDPEATAPGRRTVA